MKREDLLLLLLVLALLLAALLTILTGGSRSRHGVGARLGAPENPVITGAAFPG